MSDIWDRLKANRNASQGRRIKALLDDEEGRMERFSVSACDMFLDFSKVNIDIAALDLLIELAGYRGVPQARSAMFEGAKINRSEDRAVLHTALRSRDKTPLVVDGQDIRPDIANTRRAMESFADGIRSGRIASVSGRPFTDILNIGIGGSDLGPVMAVRALSPYHTGPKCHFVSNVDGAQISDTLKSLNPHSTLVIVASKTFTTIETMTNARTAMNWLRNALGDKAPNHIAAVSTALDKTAELGIDPERVFGFSEWVGGRYSLWGPVGLPIMLAIGPSEFRNFLQGAAEVDEHFCNAPLEQNMPVLMALIGVWHRSIRGFNTRAILPYDQRLSKLPAYLQQLDMESNGKSVSNTGAPLEHGSGPVVWGEAGTNGQHAFYQLLHQGTEVIPAEFLIARDSHEASLREHHELLKANCIAQSEALMLGRSFEEAMALVQDMGFAPDEKDAQAAYRTFPGNRPSMTLVYPLLTPKALGSIIALYEHRVFVEGTIWGLNPFDQWGVELGKVLARQILPLLKGEQTEHRDASTDMLISRLA